jgi:hypothetical protein
MSQLGLQYSGAILSAIHPLTVLLPFTTEGETAEDNVETLSDNACTPSNSLRAAFCVPDKI